MHRWPCWSSRGNHSSAIDIILPFLCGCFVFHLDHVILRQAGAYASGIDSQPGGVLEGLWRFVPLYRFGGEGIRWIKYFRERLLTIYFYLELGSVAALVY